MSPALAAAVFLSAGLLPAPAAADDADQATGGGAPAGRPNIVLFLVDDLGARDLGCYGSPLYETPHADRLAEAGVRFTRAYAAYPRCVPSRVGLLSGKYPARVEAARFARPRDERSPHALPLAEVTFGEAFREAGYATCYLGKWHLGHGDDGDPTAGGPGEQGFDTVVHAGSAGATGTFFPVFGEGRGDGEGEGAFPVEKGNAVANPLTGEPGDDLTGRLTDAAVDYVKQAAAGDAPFLMVLSHYAVHTPLEATEEGEKKYARKLRRAGVEKGGGREDADLVRDRRGMVKTVQNNPTYAAMVERVDDSLGRVLAALEAAGVRENTVVVFTSDHGGLSTRGPENWRELATANTPLRQGKGSILEGGLRVPLIVAGPDVRRGAVAPDVVHGVDLYPTLLERARLPLRPDQHVDGLSFGPALEGLVNGRPDLFWAKWRARPGSTGDDRAAVLMSGDWKLIEWLDPLPADAGSAGDGGPPGGATWELFDVAADPGETTNRAAEQPDRLAAMKARLRTLEVATGADALRTRGG